MTDEPEGGQVIDVVLPEFMIREVSERELIEYVNERREGRGCPTCGATGLESLANAPKSAEPTTFGSLNRNLVWVCYGAHCTNCGFVYSFFHTFVLDWLRRREGGKAGG